MRRSVDFGAWWSYVYDRLAGFEVREEAAKKGRAAWTFGSKERKNFAEFYAEEASAGQTASQAYGAQGSTSSARMYGLTCLGPVKYTGQHAIERDTANLAAHLEAHTKVVGQPILIDENTREGLSDGIRIESHGLAQLKTRSQAVQVYSVPAGQRP